MKHDVKTMIADIIRIEGGYVNHPNDKGGPTQYGVTLKTLEAWRNEDLEARDVQLLSKSEAAEIYEANYYLQPGINHLPESLQPVVFDMAVNMGPLRAIKLMQQVIHKMGTPITIDGHIGPRTRQSAVIACNVYGSEVLRQICALRKDCYREIAAHDPSQRVFLAGWIKRSDLFLA
ncbi:MAG: glycoside hydrolase family 108 protein [Methylobacter sp.]